jgi:hypothetical protein
MVFWQHGYLISFQWTFRRKYKLFLWSGSSLLVQIALVEWEPILSKIKNKVSEINWLTDKHARQILGNLNKLQI